MKGGATGRTSGLRAVATLEASKGALVLLAGSGAFALIHRDAEALAEELLGHLHLNPAHHTPQIFLEAAARVTDARLWALAAGALVYAVVRFLEAWGLWRARPWAEWFGALSGSLYIPFEVVALVERVSVLRVVVLLVNGLVVGYLARLLLRSRRGRRE